MLDVGSGWGELLLACIDRGAQGCGIEPTVEEVAIAALYSRATASQRL